MKQFVSSTNLAIDHVNEFGVYPKDTQVVINHTDCDSILSSLILTGVLPPDKKFSDAAIAADHTGEENEITDLLMAIEHDRDIRFSVRNLQLYLDGLKIEQRAQELLEKRIKDREKIKKLVEDGKFGFTKNDVAYVTLDKKVDGGLVPALLPDAKAIVLASKMPEGPKRKKEWLIKVRSGLQVPKGFSLVEVQLPDFGDRWNAGSTKRHGGTNLNAEQYAEVVDQKIAEYLKEQGM